MRHCFVSAAETSDGRGRFTVVGHFPQEVASMEVVVSFRPSSGGEAVGWASLWSRRTDRATMWGGFLSPFFERSPP